MIHKICTTCNITAKISRVRSMTCTTNRTSSIYFVICNITQLSTFIKAPLYFHHSVATSHEHQMYHNFWVDITVQRDAG